MQNIEISLKKTIMLISVYLQNPLSNADADVAIGQETLILAQVFIFNHTLCIRAVKMLVSLHIGV